MIYLKVFSLPDKEQELGIIRTRMSQNGGAYGYIDNPYPCGIFADKLQQDIVFDRTTIFYGSNGSGKSTLLNLVAQKLELNRVAPFNSSETFDLYLQRCRYAMEYDEEGFKMRIPNGSRIITSDDVFDYMLAVRTNNQEIAEGIEEAKGDYDDLKYGDTIKLTGIEDYEQFRLQVLSRTKSSSRRKYIRRVVGQEVKLQSNGETALEYFNAKMKPDTLYCLDEPENSLSPKLQIELVRLLEELVRCCGCQLIIATHSPFLLAMNGAKIYDLDSSPISVRKWWELDNTKTYFEFFNKHRKLFEV